MICEVDGRTDVLVGIADGLYAHKNNCKGYMKKPGIFTNIGYHIEFIKSQMEKFKARDNSAISLQISLNLMMTVISFFEINNFL